MTKIVTTEGSGGLRHAVSSWAFLLALFTPATAAAQLIVVRTLPIADAHQFSFFPSLTAGMGGVTIAVTDSVHDPFINPAAGARLRHPLFFSAPRVFSVSGDAGRGRTYPLGAVARTGSSFGGAAVAIQSITEAQPLGATSSGFVETQPNGGDGSRSNHYGFLMLGRTFAASRLSFGASALWSDLATIDGTALLYSDSRRVSQAGRAADVRFGILKEWNGGQSLEALLFNHRVGMRHDVIYGDLYWDPIGRRTVVQDRLQRERDRTSTWGMHIEYARPIGDSGWRAGVMLTANRVDNPSRPAYEIEAVPGARGRSAAFNLGVGLARSLGATTVAVDAIYEPIWSRIWGVSDTASTGTTTQPGNEANGRLRFSNGILRTGVAHDLTLPDRESKLQLQLGVEAHSISYRLDRQDLVRSTRDAERSWMEWTRSLGATVRLASVEIQYRARKTTGAGRPGISPVFPDPPSPGFGFVSESRPLAPATTLRHVSVTTHQLSLSLSIR